MQCVVAFGKFKFSESATIVLMSWLNSDGVMSDKMRAFLVSAGCPETAEGKLTCEVPDTVHDTLLKRFWKNCPLCDEEGGVVGPG